MSGLDERVRRILVVATALFALAFPWLPFVSFSLLGSANLAAYLALVAVSIVVLTGWVGQISLGHAGLVGVGAYMTGYVTSTLGLTFPASMLWAGVAGGGVAILLGTVALRVRGLYLAVATLIFSWMASEFLFRQDWITKFGLVDVKPLGEPLTFPYFDWTSRRTYFYAAWATVVVAVLLMSNLRRSKTGRAFFAVRGSEVAAASMGISVVRTKLVAFAVSGVLAGIAGNLLIIRDQVVSSDAFTVEVSLFFVAVAVVGGLSSLGGAIAGGALFAALEEIFFRVEAFAGWLEVVPPVLLGLVLLLYRGGLAAIPDAAARRAALLAQSARTWLGEPHSTPADEELDDDQAGGVGEDAVAVEAIVSDEGDEEAAAPEPSRVRAFLAALGRRFIGEEMTFDSETRLDLSRVFDATETDADGDDEIDEQGTDSEDDGALAGPLWQRISLGRIPLPPSRDERRILLEASGVTVKFGGLTAVDDVSLTVREHEIVGLIGPNGAGKTTTFNAIAGLNVPTSGNVSLYGRDVTTWTVDERARLGVGRTFQAIQLLPQLTVFENLLVATHVHNPSGLLSHLLIGPSTLQAERDGRDRVARVARLLQLEDVLDQKITDLPFGVLRMVEVARALVTEARLIMLDEPASGLDNTETERLAEILRFVRNLGVTLLLIEHDVHMVTSVSDYIYVLDQGCLISEGTPATIQSDTAVIAAYLGTDADEVDEEGVDTLEVVPS